ncbi:uncharacterized protein LOC108908163 [Anoplophora glabripennis]|uniref:uncharacterized protein LOC108908163 n=1 Tax=Anoplophora glabripennis TaxID=217634 RepID=UPI0008742D69|nr:uncharacterized protein LOC108908163 [Anoplophora glabripennis]
MTETTLSEEEQWRRLVRHFFIAAIYQGRVAYCIMSIHAVNPYILNSILSYDPYPYLWANMIYGIAVMIFSRPSLRIIVPINRLSFGILGSLMFNHSSMICYHWLSTVFPNRPYVLTIMAFFSGRFMMMHLLAFLYHLDSRSHMSGSIVPRDYTLESMYL